jgi:threonine/homoserine/homoserine lactone efflux protein
MIPSYTSLLLFVSAALALLMIPGPAVFYIVGRAMGQGRAAGLVSALGIAVGTLFHVAAAVVGLSAVAFSVVKYLGAAYLIFLGVQKLRSKDSFAPSGPAEQTPLHRVFAQGIVVNILNPKTALFFFAFIPQFVDSSRGKVPGQILFLGMLFALMGALTDSLWGLFAGTLARWLRGNSRWTQAPRYVSGGMLISLGVATAFTGSGAKK